MPGGKYGTKQVYDDDFDYDDYLDDDIEDDEESEFIDTPSKAAARVPGTPGASTILPSVKPSAQEYDEFISELLGEEGVEEQAQESQIHLQEELDNEATTNDGTKSSLYQYLTEPPPPRRSGQPQRTGRQQEAAELAQQICANIPAHAAAAEVQRLGLSDWASTDVTLQSSTATDGDPANSWPKKTAERQANVPSAAQLSSATPCQPGHAANKAYWLEELLALRSPPIAISQKQSHHDGEPSHEMELLLRPDSHNLALTSNEKLAVDDNGWQIPPPEVFQPLEQDNTLHGQDVMAPKTVKYSPLAAKGPVHLDCSRLQSTASSSSESFTFDVKPKRKSKPPSKNSLQASSRLSKPVLHYKGDADGIELDEDGWQKLPLYVELDMLQQAAHGSDGTSCLQANDQPRDRWWKQDRTRRPDKENGEPSLRELRKKSPPPQQRRSVAEYVMDADLKKRCKEAAAQETAGLNGKTKLHLVVLGHVDAGKSTLMGRLLHELGMVSQKVVHKHQKDAASMGKASFAWAWLLDERPQERARGVTIDVASAYFETAHHAVTLLDAPGHRDFVPNMIAGAAQADAALLLVDGSTGNFEAGFEPSSGFGSMGGGQTREHAQLARSLGVDQLAVVISKLDTCDYSQGRFQEIKALLSPFLKQCGFKESSVQWLPAVGILNQNLVKAPDAPQLTAWWSGPTLVDAIDSFTAAKRQVESPLRLPINDIFKGDRGGQSVGGKIEAGAIKAGTQVKVMPSGESGSIKTIVMKNTAVSLGRAGDSADVTLAGLDTGVLISGAVICHPDFPVPMVTKFLARVVVLDVNAPVLRGQEVTIHAHAAMENGHISQLVATVDPKTGESSKKKPRVLTKNQSAVIEVTVLRAICLEQYSDCRALGRIILREGGQTLAVGVVTSILG